MSDWYGFEWRVGGEPTVVSASGLVAADDELTSALRHSLGDLHAPSQRPLLVWVRRSPVSVERAYPCPSGFCLVSADDLIEVVLVPMTSGHVLVWADRAARVVVSQVPVDSAQVAKKVWTAARRAPQEQLSVIGARSLSADEDLLLLAPPIDPLPDLLQFCDAAGLPITTVPLVREVDGWRVGDVRPRLWGFALPEWVASLAHYMVAGEETIAPLLPDAPPQRVSLAVRLTVGRDTIAGEVDLPVRTAFSEPKWMLGPSWSRFLRSSESPTGLLLERAGPGDPAPAVLSARLDGDEVELQRRPNVAGAVVYALPSTFQVPRAAPIGPMREVTLTLPGQGPAGQLWSCPDLVRADWSATGQLLLSDPVPPPLCVARPAWQSDRQRWVPQDSAGGGEHSWSSALWSVSRNDVPAIPVRPAPSTVRIVGPPPHMAPAGGGAARVSIKLEGPPGAVASEVTLVTKGRPALELPVNRGTLETPGFNVPGLTRVWEPGTPWSLSLDRWVDIPGDWQLCRVGAAGWFLPSEEDLFVDFRGLRDTCRVRSLPDARCGAVSALVLERGFSIDGFKDRLLSALAPVAAAWSRTAHGELRVWLAAEPEFSPFAWVSTNVSLGDLQNLQCVSRTPAIEAEPRRQLLTWGSFLVQVSIAGDQPSVTFKGWLLEADGCSFKSDPVGFEPYAMTLTDAPLPVGAAGFAAGGGFAPTPTTTAPRTVRFWRRVTDGVAPR